MHRLSERRAVLFDLDGTLIDSSADLQASVNDTLADHGLAPLALDEVRAMIGDGAAVLVHRAFAAYGRPEPVTALPRFRERYGTRCLERTRPYDGVVELLERLRADPHRAIGVLTNKPTEFAKTILHGLGLGRLLHAVVGPELTPARKPSPAHVLTTLAHLGAAPAEAVVVGDGPTDMISGREAGCATVAVLWGYRPRSELEAERPAAIVSTVAELGQVLLG